MWRHVETVGGKAEPPIGKLGRYCTDVQLCQSHSTPRQQYSTYALFILQLLQFAMTDICNVPIRARKLTAFAAIFFFLASLQNCEMRLLTSSHLFVRPSAWNHSVSTERIFMKFDIYFRKYIENIQVSLHYDRNNRYLTWKPIHIFDYISQNSS